MKENRSIQAVTDHQAFPAKRGWKRRGIKLVGTMALHETNIASFVWIMIFFKRME
jgi:hypothetical protein